MGYTIKEKHITNVRRGDTVLCRDGQIRTVSRNNIKNCLGIGVTLFGDSYNCGNKLVKVLDIKNK